MEYSLYVYGGGQILWYIFSGIALVFKSNNPYFTSLGQITIGIGLLYVIAQALPRASLSLFLKSWALPTILLNTLFFGPKASVHIIDKVDVVEQKYSKVDNIPVGIAAVASFSSNLSEYLTDSIETIFQISNAERFSEVGSMFGAKLIHAATTLTVKDPLMKENLKDFARQCFAWPYVFSNLDPGKKAALETQDMIEFIASNPHPLLGVYWRSPSGDAQFVNCKDCVAQVRNVLNLEVNNSFATLESSLFGAQKLVESQSMTGEVQTTTRLKQYFGDAWNKLAKGSSDSAKIIQQELMLNSYREALQDKRDELRLGRSDIEMAYLNAGRGIAQQDSSFLVKAIMAGTLVPVFHTIIFAVALIYFSMMAPMTFLPRGTMLLWHWVKVMLYLATWPPLFAILNCLGQMFAAKAMQGRMMGYGEGLNLLTQTGLADISYNAYMAVIGMQLSVPFLAWALLWGGGYAFSQLASSLTQSGESFAGKAGSETVDGNVSFDTQSLHTRSVANTQIAQQQLGSSLNYGSRVDDGKLATLYGPGGQATIQEYQTQLGTNVSQNDTLSTFAGIQSQIAANSSSNYNRQSGEQIQEGLGHLHSVTDHFADSKNWTETFGNHESSQAQQSLNKSMEIANSFADEHGLDRQKTFNAMVEAGLKMDKGSIGKGVLGVLKGLSAGMNGSYSASASDKDTFSMVEKSGKAKNFIDSLNHGIQYLQDNKGSLGQSSQIQDMDQAQRNFNQANTYSELANVSMNESQMWSRQASEQRQKSLSSGTNITPQVLSYIADKKFGGDAAAAATWQTQNPNDFQKETINFLEQRQSTIKTGDILTPQQVQQHHKQSQEKINEISKHTQGIEKQLNSSNRAQQEEALNTKLFEEGIKTQQGLKRHKNGIAYDDIQKNMDQKKQNFRAEEEKFLPTKTFEKVVK